MKRDRLLEIASVRDRGQGSGSTRIRHELAELAAQWSGQADLTGPTQFVIIRLVTLLEVFTREWVAQIIDAGEPYSSRSPELVKGTLKIDFALAQALIGKQVTFGELISHDIAVSQISDVDRVFSELLGRPLFEALEGVVDRWEVEVVKQPPEPLLPDVTASRAMLAQLFQKRHILVHELPADDLIDIEVLRGYIRTVSAFVSAADQAFSTLLHGQYPITQTEMNEVAFNDADRADAELAAVLAKLDPEKSDEALHDSQRAWEIFRDRHAEYRSGIKGPSCGSIAPLLHASELTNLTRSRIDQLNRYLSREEGEL